MRANARAMMTSIQPWPRSCGGTLPPPAAAVNPGPTGARAAGDPCVCGAAERHKDSRYGATGSVARRLPSRQTRHISPIRPRHGRPAESPLHDALRVLPRLRVTKAVTRVRAGKGDVRSPRGFSIPRPLRLAYDAAFAGVEASGESMNLRRILFTLFLAAFAAGATPAHAETNVLFIFDSSGSMKKKVDNGEARMTVAKRAMAQALKDMPAGVRVGLLLYGHRKAKDCTDIELKSPIGADDAAAIARIVGDLKPKGETPIAAALEQAIRSFAALKGQSNRVVLVTDGIEECGGDVCAAAQTVADAGLDLRVDVVGFTLTEKQAQTIRCIPEKTGGKYYEASNATGLTAAFNEVTQQVQTAAARAEGREPDRGRQRRRAGGGAQRRMAQAQRRRHRPRDHLRRRRNLVLQGRQARDVRFVRGPHSRHRPIQPEGIRVAGRRRRPARSVPLDRRVLDPEHQDDAGAVPALRLPAGHRPLSQGRAAHGLGRRLHRLPTSSGCSASSTSRRRRPRRRPRRAASICCRRPTAARCWRRPTTNGPSSTTASPTAPRPMPAKASGASATASPRPSTASRS